MAILTPKESGKRVLRELDPNIESEINRHLEVGVYEWMMDNEWLIEKDLIKDTLFLSGWICKMEQRESLDPEVRPWWIKLTAKNA